MLSMTVFKETSELVEILLKLINHDYSKMAEAAYLSAMKFSSEVFYEKVIAVYQQAINSKHYSYTVKSIYPVKRGINEVVFLFDESEIIVEVNDKLIKAYQLEPNKVIDKELFDVLKDFEQVSRAYNKITHSKRLYL